MANIIPSHRAGKQKHWHKSNTQAKENIGTISKGQENSIDQLCRLLLGIYLERYNLAIYKPDTNTCLVKGRTENS